MINESLSTSTLRLAKVTYVHPEGQCVDVIFMDSGDYGRDVMVMSPYAGTDFGFTGGIPRPQEEGHDPNARTEPDRRHIIAVVGMVNGRYVALGFLYPQITHMAFVKDSDPDRMIERHPSDHYRTIDTDANFEQYHPGDAWFKIAEGIGHEDLTGKDFDKRWKLQHNTETEPVITLFNRRSETEYTTIQVHKGEVKVQAVNGGQMSNVTVKPDEIRGTTTGTIHLTAAGEITITSGTYIHLVAPVVDVN
ncbi:MAG: hypothetical protein MUF20_03205 [Methylotetracoccus sp.]|jgi:hypothetical protein|nr:hypothetical protein [Methylotetracoccus sp.]